MGLALPIGFLALAGVFLLMPRLAPIPIAPAVVVAKEDITVAPRRVAMTDPPRIQVEGLPENCNACHQIFQSTARGDRPLDYHTEITLSHGLNDRCINCHDANDRERLTLRDGATIPFSQTPQLCSQCHGTTFRDWQRGTHGKTLGSWITGSPLQVRLGCNECHDPHSPRYTPYVPLPGPNTLRMGEQHEHDHTKGKQSPLQRWRNHPHATPTSEGAHE